MAHLTQKNKRDLRDGRDVSIVVDVAEKYSMPISIRLNSSGDGYIIRGYLQRKNPNERATSDKQRLIKNLETADIEIDILGRYLASTLMTKGPKSPKSAGTIGDFRERVMSVEELFDPVNWGIRKSTHRELHPDTIHKRITYMIGIYEDMFTRFKHMNLTETEMRAFKQEEIDRILKQQNSNAKNTITRDSVFNGVNQRWKYAEEARKLLIIFGDIDGLWPENPLLVDVSLNTPSPELAKVFPYKYYIYAVTVLIRCCRAEIPEAFGGAGEMLAGARVGESAAMRIGKFQFRGDIGRYYIDEQIDSHGQVTDVLKNEYSKRFTFFENLMKKIVNLKRKQLLSVGFSPKEISEAFLTSEKETPLIPIRKERISAFLKDLLITVGCDPTEIEILEAEVSGDKGYDSDHDLCAHICRKFFATMLSNGGIKTNIVDAMLGHINTANKGIDYSGWDVAETMVRMISRCLYYGSLASTYNPAYRSEELNESSELILDGNRTYSFIARKGGYIELEIETMESDDSIYLYTNSKGKVDIEVAQKIDDNKNRCGRMVLSKLPSKAEIEEMIDVANKMDISNLIKKYGGKNEY